MNIELLFPILDFHLLMLGQYRQNISSRQQFAFRHNTLMSSISYIIAGLPIITAVA